MRDKIALKILEIILFTSILVLPVGIANAYAGANVAGFWQMSTDLTVSGCTGNTDLNGPCDHDPYYWTVPNCMGPDNFYMSQSGNGISASGWQYPGGNWWLSGRVHGDSVTFIVTGSGHTPGIAPQITTFRGSLFGGGIQGTLSGYDTATYEDEEGNMVPETCEWSGTFTVTIETPTIEDITITGSSDDPKNPMTTKEVTLEAIITDAPGYEIEHTSWTFDLPVGFILTGNPKTFEPAAGTHGNRQVECQIFYKNTATGETGMDSKTKEFKLFFVKGQPHPNIADEDRDGDPNWFEYWRGTLGSPPVNYKPVVNWGSASIATGAVSIGDNAGFGPDPRHAKIGIDCYYCVMTHELQHRSDIRYTIGKYGSVSTVPAANDTDGDRLPNEIDPFPNTVNGAGYPEYAGSWVGDWEYKARQVEDVTASNSLDWANPGKQSNGVNNPHSYASQSIAYNNGGFRYLDQPGGVQAEFTGNYYDYGIDTDGDGLYDYLILEVEVNVTAAGNYTLIGGLEGADYTLWTVSSGYLGVGVQTIVLNFDGLEIRQHREDGPYPISLTIESGFSLEHVFSTYNTSAYNYADFERQATEFTCTYSDYGTDTDGDGLYNCLTAELSVNITTAGDYTLEGWLYDKNGTAMMMANNSTYLEIGDQSVLFSFDGLTLRSYRVDGPYNLKYLKLYDENDTQIDFIYDAYNTSAYSYDDFQSSSTWFRENYLDYGNDTDSDGLYNYLTIDVEVNITTPRNYSIIGWLYDDNGSQITWAITNFTYLEAGIQSISLTFDGMTIYQHGVNGPYNLTDLTLFNENGITDYIKNAYITSSYSYTDFQKPDFGLTNVFSDYGTDTDSDGLYNYLTTDVEVNITTAGNYGITGWLYDSTGTEITGIGNYTYLNSGIQSMLLNFEGMPIYLNGMNGSYNLSLSLYNEADFIYQHNVYTTSAYDYTDFQKGGVITGIVTDINGTEISDVRIKALGPMSKTDCTDEAGYYEIAGLWNGSYSVIATPPHDTYFMEDSANVNLTSDKIIILDFTLLLAAQNEVYLVPQHGNTTQCNTTVQIWINGTDIAGAYINFTYDPACVNVTDVKSANFPTDWDWNSAISGREIIAGTTSDGLNRTGNYLFANLTIHCLINDCTTGLNFSEGKDLFDDHGLKRPAAWTDGTFTCLKPSPYGFTTADAVIALHIAVGSRPPDLRWDVSGDGSVTSLDALMILQAACGKVDLYSASA